MQNRLLEIDAEEQATRHIVAEALSRLDSLAKERYAILSMTIRRSGPTLEFDKDGKTIRWDGGAVELGGKSHRFVRVLWATKKRRMKASDLENIVWEGRIVSSETVRNFVWRLSNRLKLVDFPFEIKSIKKPQTMEVTGFKLRVAFRCVSDATNATG